MSVRKDADWVKRAFMVTPKMTQAGVLNRRLSNSAQYKFTDTTIGGNRYINSLPQFTSNADIKENGYGVSKGMGRFYSECYDDNAVIAYMRFGVAEPNSLGSFYTNFFSPTMSYIAKTGEAPGMAFNFGRGLTFVSTLGYQTLVYSARAFGGFVNYLRRKPYSKYYYLKPTSGLYWNAVNTIVNQIGVNKGIIGPAGVKEQGDALVPNALSDEEMRAYSQLLPDIFQSDESGHGIDVYRLANRAQRLSDARLARVNRAAQKAKNKEEYTRAMMDITPTGELNKMTRGDSDGAAPNLPEYMKRYQSSIGRYSPPVEKPMKDESGAEVLDANGKPVQTTVKYEAIDGHDDSYLEQLAINMKANMRDGSEWVAFKIDAERTVSESFQSEVGESEVSNKLKGMASTTNSFMFSMGGGNLGDNAIANFAEDVMGGIMKFAAGVATQLHVGGLLGLVSGAFPDIPKHWQDSSANLPTSSFSVQLRAPYGHPMSTFLNLDIPLAMLLAGALPLSTGRHSYTSPFLVEYYCKSRSQTRLGIIDSIDITRGAGSHGWTVDQYVRGIDVTVSIVDLSSVMHMPVTESLDFVDDVFGAGMFADDNAFTDYMAVLGGLGFESQVYPLDSIRRKRYLGLEKFDDWMSPGHLASVINDALPGRLMSAISNRRFNSNVL